MSETSFNAFELRPLFDVEETPFIGAGRRDSYLKTRRKLSGIYEFVDDTLTELIPLVSGVPAEPDPGLRGRVLTAIDEIRSALEIAESAAASLVGVARNTLASWRREEREPYPSTVRTVFEVHSLINAARAVHADDTVAWFHGRIGDRTRLELLSQPGGLEAVTADLRNALFPRRPRPLVDDDINDIHDDSDDSAPTSAAVRSSGPVRQAPRIN